MAGSVKIILKKIFSLALILNALITVGGVVGILNGFYGAFPFWKPYEPYVIDGNLFWLSIVAALVNIFPSASIGRALHTGRFLFHHYIYGFFVLLSSSAFIVMFTSVSLFSLFLVDSTSIAVNSGRFFVLAGLALVLDDLPDVSKNIEPFLNWLKSKAYRGRKVLFALQLLSGGICLYLSLAIAIFTVQNPQRVLSDSILIGSLLITSLTSLALVKKKAWLKITVD
jgi:hypothetical protein